ncbi:MAG: hypothetical protein HY738_05690 [Bacteroidia bacterium]|nr:hypothetical protein [Bacteroidia bacterium]
MLSDTNSFRTLTGKTRADSLTRFANVEQFADSFAVVDYNLPHPLYDAYKNIREKWFRQEYFACLKNAGIEMSCAGCEYVYIDVVLIIDYNGKLKKYKIINSNVCARDISPELEKCFLNFFHNVIFPECLRGEIINTMLGTGLTC